MKTSLKDVIKINKRTNVQFFKLSDNLITEMKRQIHHKKNANELCLYYTVPPYRLGNISYDRQLMFDEIFKNVKDKYHIVNRLPQFKIYIEWKPKPKKDVILPILCHLDKLILKNANKNRTFCTYTLPASMGKNSIHETRRIIKKIKLKIEQQGFRVESESNKIIIYFDVKPEPIIHTESDLIQPISLKPPDIIKFSNIKNVPQNINLNNYSCITPIDTRRGKSTVMDDFKKFKKNYDTLCVSSPSKKLFPAQINTKPRPRIGHVLTRRTILETDEMQKQMQELDKINKPST
jgi:hypothetical protein